MQFSTLAWTWALAFAPLIRAQIAGLPTCAESCALNAISSTGCAVTDFHCICTASSFLAGVESCISTACSAADQEATLQYAEQLCGSVGVTITPPSAPATSAPAAASSPASSVAASPTSSAAPPSYSNTTTASTPTIAPFTGAAVSLPNSLPAAGLGGFAVLLSYLAIF